MLLFTVYLLLKAMNINPFIRPKKSHRAFAKRNLFADFSIKSRLDCDGKALQKWICTRKQA